MSRQRSYSNVHNAHDSAPTHLLGLNTITANNMAINSPDSPKTPCSPDRSFNSPASRQPRSSPHEQSPPTTPSPHTPPQGQFELSPSHPLNLTRSTPRQTYNRQRNTSAPELQINQTSDPDMILYQDAL